MSRLIPIFRLACLGSLVVTGCSADDNNPVPAATYGISGTVSGSSVADVTISLSGAAISSTTTNASGQYSFTGLPSGSYTVTPSSGAYAFLPARLAIHITSADVTGQDFSAYAGTATLRVYWDGCTAQDCGPAMGAPNYSCTDGTIGGPGPCKRDDGGHCGWSYRSCENVTLCTGCVVLGYSAVACDGTSE